LGDVGGTNLRLFLKKLYPRDRSKTEELHYLKQDVQNVDSFIDAMKFFLKVINKMITINLVNKLSS